MQIAIILSDDLNKKIRVIDAEKNSRRETSTQYFKSPLRTGSIVAMTNVMM